MRLFLRLDTTMSTANGVYLATRIHIEAFVHVRVLDNLSPRTYPLELIQTNSLQFL